MERALFEALALWRQRPSEALAHHIDRLSDALTAQRPAVAPEAWLDVCARRHPADLGRLLAALPGSSPAVLHARLDALWRWPRDPRVAEGLRRLTLHGLRAQDTGVWRRVLALVSHAGDSRASLWLNDALVELDGPPAAVRRFVQRAQECLLALHRPLREPHLEDCALPPGRIESTAPPPDELHARLVFADGLSEAGDPRGEFIVLQSFAEPRRAQRRRMDALLRAYARSWLGRLSPALKLEGLRFTFGYPVAGRLSGYRALRDLVGAPEWSTFVELNLRELARRAPHPELLLRFLGHSALSGITRLVAFPASCVTALCTSTAPLPVQLLEVSGWVGPAAREALWRSAALPRLQTLTVEGLSVPSPEGAPSSA
jgi:uncharacterized protein (TIGR02996 family)